MKSDEENTVYSVIEINYRKLFGKLFASLTALYGTQNITLIEDAIQNSFLKAMKSWKPNQLPRSPENWFFVVCKNDIINKLKKQNHRTHSNKELIEDQEINFEDTDLRLLTLNHIVNIEGVSTKSKMIFSLKSIFGLNVQEIEQCTLLKPAAIYKLLKRTEEKFKKAGHYKLSNSISPNTIPILNEMLYSVFNTGFDITHERSQLLVNIDVCTEAIALAKHLNQQISNGSTQNLLSLFCFHMARIDSKITNDQFVLFSNQNPNDWDPIMIQLGFHYLNQPDTLDRYYLEALIVSKHMMNNHVRNQLEHWKEIERCYKLLERLNDSPIIKLNHAYSLHKIEQHDEAQNKINQAKSELPENHFYYLMVASQLYPSEAAGILSKSLNFTHQNTRKELIMSKIDVRNKTWNRS